MALFVTDLLSKLNVLVKCETKLQKQSHFTITTVANTDVYVVVSSFMSVLPGLAYAMNSSPEALSLNFPLEILESPSPELEFRLQYF